MAEEDAPAVKVSDAASADIVAGVLAGEPHAVARMLTLVERGEAELAPLRVAVRSANRDARVIGVTGPPGAGKSVLVSRLVEHYRQRGAHVGAILVDPSSPRSGGALLGDRLRLDALSADPAVFVRSMATRGVPGGLARGVAGGIVVLLAAGYEVVLIESVGAGQSDLAISEMVDTTVLVHLPGAGDTVQLEKAGLIEVADVHVVNKADVGPAAERLVAELEVAAAHVEPGTAGWAPPVVATVATEGQGVERLVEELDRHHAHLGPTAMVSLSRANILATAEVLAAADAALRSHLGADRASGALLEAVAIGLYSPEEAATRLLAKLVSEQAANALLNESPEESSGGLDLPTSDLPEVPPGD